MTSGRNEKGRRGEKRAGRESTKRNRNRMRITYKESSCGGFRRSNNWARRSKRSSCGSAHNTKTNINQTERQRKSEKARDIRMSNRQRFVAGMQRIDGKLLSPITLRSRQAVATPHEAQEH